MFFKFLGEHVVEVFFPGEEIRDYTYHIDVCIIAVSLDTVAAEDFQSITKLVESIFGKLGVYYKLG